MGLLQQWCHAFFLEATLSHIFPVVPCSFYHGLRISGHADATALLPTARQVACRAVCHSSRRRCRWRSVHTIFVWASAERSLHPVQGLKSHLRLIRRSMIFGQHTRFLGGDLYARATYTRVYTVLVKHGSLMHISASSIRVRRSLETWHSQ